MTTPLQSILPKAARLYGDRTALVVDGKTWSFADLDRESLACAGALIRSGVMPGDRVTIYSGNGAPWIIAYHGALRAGAIVNPLNVMLTAPEVGFVLNDCGARVILASNERAGMLAEANIGGDLLARVCLEGTPPAGWTALADLLEAEAGRPAPDLPARAPDDASTIGYTSGTTGHPKGAVLSHRAVHLNAAMTAVMHGRSAADTVVTALPTAHVYGNVVMNGAFLTGMKLVLMPRFDAAEALELIRSHKATMFEGVPAMYVTILDEPGLDSRHVASLTRCTVGGQTMPVVAMEAVEDKLGAPLLELWGMTEVAGLGTTHPHLGVRRLGSIGVALPFVETRIADPENGSRDMPRGEPGELMVRGPIVMQGYFGNAEATAETIRPDGWLHTGDIATMDAEGYVTVVDRKKDVILSGGYNVYPAEIERVLAEHPDVAISAVGRLPDPVKGEAAAAYVVLKRNATVDEDTLMAFMRDNLARWKCPRIVRLVDDLPRTSTGKIRRRELAEVFGDLEPTN